MDFGVSEQGRLIEDQVLRFLREKVLPAEKQVAAEEHDIQDGSDTPTMLRLRAAAKALGLWNLYLPDKEWGAGVSNHDY